MYKTTVYSQGLPIEVQVLYSITDPNDKAAAVCLYKTSYLVRIDKELQVLSCINIEKAFNEM